MPLDDETKEKLLEAFEERPDLLETFLNDLSPIVLKGMSGGASPAMHDQEVSK